MNTYFKTLNRLAKWRKIFVSWQLGTRSDTDPEAKALADHREVTILLRAEMNALTRLMLEKKVFTETELMQTVESEAEFLMRAFEKIFPGAEATDGGMIIDLRKAQEWMSKFPL